MGFLSAFRLAAEGLVNYAHSPGMYVDNASSPSAIALMIAAALTQIRIFIPPFLIF